ncbi:MAG TPA: hypothetical protein VFH74_13420 [Gaiellales bacterium]|nr:hypothetical protein [Gaiellales bacterium]
MRTEAHDTEMVTKARSIAIRAHRGQLDKAGEDYFRAHVLDVVTRVGEDPALRAIAYLHDVVEDTEWTLLNLLNQNVPTFVVDAVAAITHRPNEPRDDYYARVKANRLALAVKLADIESNTDPIRMSWLDEATRDRLTRKYEHARAVLA